MKYAFHYDAGHGWLEVPVKELKELGIYEKISPYSYERNGMAYLEEDCDFGIFLDAKKKKGETVSKIDVDNGNNSRIRQYNRIRSI